MWGHELHSRPKRVHFEMVFLNVLIEPFEIQNHAIFATFLFLHKNGGDVFTWRVYSRFNNTQFKQVSNF